MVGITVSGEGVGVVIGCSTGEGEGVVVVSPPPNKLSGMVTGVTPPSFSSEDGTRTSSVT